MRSFFGNCWRATAWAIASAILLWLSFFPANVGVLSLVALTPMLMLVRMPITGVQRTISAWLGGLVFFLAAVSWMRLADETMLYGWLCLSLYCSLYFPIAIWLIRRLVVRASLPFVIATPLAWISLEYVRSWMITGFPWYYLGHALHSSVPLIQIADLGGSYAVSLLVAAVNGLVVDWLSGNRTVRRWSAMVALAFVASYGYGVWRLSQSTTSPGPRVALLQCNLPQDVRTDAFARGEGTVMILRQFAELTDEARYLKPDLIVWPETSWPFETFFAAPKTPRDDLVDVATMINNSQDDVAQAARRSGVATVIGSNSRTFAGNKKETRANSAIYLDRAGAIIGRYDKIHRVPFGEYVPWREYFPWLDKLTPYEGFDYSIEPGQEQTRFELPVGDRTYRFGVLICFEDSVADLATGYVRDPKVDFLVNMSNDGWFRCSAEHEQHLAVSRFRAVECRRALVRSVNVGISAIIDSNGEVIQVPGATWSASKGVAAAVVGEVPIDSRWSFYAWSGDWLAWACCAISAWFAFAPRRKPA